jgi:ATP-dependent DNA helicase RecQ
MGPAHLQNLLLGNGHAAKPVLPNQNGLSDRIQQVLRDFHVPTSNRRMPADLIPLIRQYLLQHSIRTGQNAHLRVSVGERWPTADVWRAWGVDSLSIDSEYLSIRARPWSATWLGADDRDPFEDVLAGKMVRSDGGCAIDPFVQDATGYDQYSCPGQREAVRAAFLMPAGSTLFVNLPTGSGKSLVGQIPALVQRKAGSVTIFVVPTVALAIDQARQMARYLSAQGAVWPLAWHGGTTSEARAEIRRRLRDGTQRILFTSPEALTTSLVGDLVSLVEAGMLSYLVIDEAHLVAQWGSDFRPAFQALGGLRNALLTKAPHEGFRTLLLSATFTSETVGLLADTFGPPDKVQMVSAVHLRPEPQYWSYRAESSPEKIDRVLELIRYCPRPFILYVTERADARAWEGRLRTMLHLTRIARFDGATQSSERERIVADWAANRLDGIVATSAFGVGVDKGDIRTIVHATIPETLDRFYQEVGRGGRDGCPSSSVLIYEASDWELPERLARPKLISDELGFNRWRALFEGGARNGNDDQIRVELNSVPRHRSGGNQYNVDWNVRTLLLMCRAALISLEVDRNPDQADSEIFDDAASPLEAMATIRVRILNHGHLRSETWEEMISPVRLSAYQAANRSLGLMRDLLVKRREVSDTLAELYAISTPRWSVDVSRVCGGCPSDRLSGVRQANYHVPSAVPLARVVAPSLKEWLDHFPWLDPQLTFVLYEGENLKGASGDSALRLVEWLVGACDVKEVCLSRSASLQSTPWRSLYKRSASGVVVQRSVDDQRDEPYSQLARVTVFAEMPTPNALTYVSYLQRPFHLVLLPRNTADPANPARSIAHVAPSRAYLADIITALSQ